MKTKLVMAMGIVLLAAAVSFGALPKNEAIGGFKIGDNAGDVIAKFGQPESKTEIHSTCEAFGQEYSYPSKGVEFTIEYEDQQGNGGIIQSMRITGPSTMKTSKGIGVGSKKNAITKAYGKPHSAQLGALAYSIKLAGKNSLVLEFALKDGAVTEINLYTASGEDC